MSKRNQKDLTLARKALLAAAAVVAIAAPMAVGVLSAQVAGQFEVATIKPSAPGGEGRGLLQFLPNGGFQAGGITLRDLIQIAYNLQSFQVTGGPSWMGSDRYDVLAKSESPGAKGTLDNPQTKNSQEVIRRRLQALLTERFQLAVHKGTRPGTVMALVVAKGGTKLEPSKQADNIPPGTVWSDVGIDARRGTMKMLAAVLTNYIGRPVVDRTGLDGNYDYKLQYAPQLPGPEGRTPQASDPAWPSVFTALQEQLGLKLEEIKDDVETLIVDRAQRPSEN